MDKKLKQNFYLVAFGIVLYALVMNISSVTSFIGKLFGLVFPIISGFIAAFLLNVPMSGFERLITKMFKRSKKPPKEATVRLVSLILTLVCLALVLTVVFVLLIPEIVSSGKALYGMAKSGWPILAEKLSHYNIDVSSFTAWLDSFSIESIIGKISGLAGSVISSAVSIASSAVSTVITVGAAAVIAIYALLEKKTLARQCKKLLYAYLNKKCADYLCHVADLINKTNSKFLSGQCLEACILGVLIFAAFAIIGIPYASLIGILAAVSAFIPYVGAFFACAVGAFLILITDPSKVLICIGVYLAVQFIENQFIYPRVVGSSVGLSPLWTLAAVLAGGNLMGLFGMIFFIPLTAVAVTLIKEHTATLLFNKYPVYESSDDDQGLQDPQGE